MIVAPRLRSGRRDHHPNTHTTLEGDMNTPVDENDVTTWPHYGDIERREDPHYTYGGFRIKGPCCGATSDGAVCTRDKVHTDPHIAHACADWPLFDTMKIVKVWPL